MLAATARSAAIDTDPGCISAERGQHGSRRATRPPPERTAAVRLQHGASLKSALTGRPAARMSAAPRETTGTPVQNGGAAQNRGAAQNSGSVDEDEDEDPDLIDAVMPVAVALSISGLT